MSHLFKRPSIFPNGSDVQNIGNIQAKHEIQSLTPEPEVSMCSYMVFSKLDRFLYCNINRPTWVQ